MVKAKKAKKPPSVKLEQVVEIPREPRFLNETDAIYFWADSKWKSETRVPPCTPQSIANLAILPSSLPTNFFTFDDLDIPYVREIGVRKCMHILSEYLGCTNYAYDYLQFWFLDILIDCLWKTQDEYYLHENEQRKVLEWVTYIFKMLIDTRACYSRKRFLKLFREMIFMAGDVLNEGDCEIPRPHNLFTIMSQEEETAEEDDNGEEEELPEEESKGASLLMSNSTISISTYKSIDIIEMEMPDQNRSFTVKRRQCWCHYDEISLDKDDLPTSLSSNISFTITNDSSMTQSDNESQEQELVESVKGENVVDVSTSDVSNQEPFPYRDFRQFYQPDSNIPKRFLPVPRSSDSKEEMCTESNTSVVSDDGDDYKGWIMDIGSDYKKSIVPQVPPDIERKEEETQADEISIRKEISHKLHKLSSTRKGVSTHSTAQSASDGSKLAHKKSSRLRSRECPVSKVSVKVPAVELSDAQIMKRLQHFKLWEKRLEDMGDPKTGWMPEQEEVQQEATTNTDEDDWEDLIETDTTTSSDKNNKNMYFNLGVLCTIIDFVFDYFYRNFHFTLIKLAVKTIPSIITQKLSSQWKIPKVIKQEFNRPKPEKKKKEKKHKRDKKSKSSKSSKGSKKSKESKKSKSKKGKSTKSTKRSDKKSKKSKSSKGSKSKKSLKLTKEEKAELQRQRKLEEEAEEEKRRLEENKIFMFPLSDAATDAFFMNIFDGWHKPKAKGAKGKKNKKKKK